MSPFSKAYKYVNVFKREPGERLHLTASISPSDAKKLPEPIQVTIFPVVLSTIKIAPYKDHPKIYNIWFEDVGVGIDLGTLYFVQ